VARQTTGAAGSHGFTLLEVLVALVIFGVITVALSFTFETALKTQEANSRRIEEISAVRAVFDYMTRDLQLAYASSNSTASAFIAGASQSGPQSASSGGLLTFMTRGNRILNDAQSASAASGASNTSGPTAATTTNPQSETQMVRYDFDPQAHTLTRSVVAVPNLQVIQQTTPDPDSVISSLVDSISLRFWDPTALSWRTDWDYEQQNQQSGATGATGTGAAGTGTGTTATTGASSQSSTAASTATGDTTLPGSVEVTVTIRHHDSTTATYVATIPVVTSQVADGMAPPTNITATASATTGSSGTGP
jgi:prepilin-type N-terminal cleavage/methylation domain-containing protein